MTRKLTEAEWQAELETALAGTGWSVVRAGISENSNTCHADARNSNGDLQHIELSTDALMNVRARMDEIRRQISN